MLNKLILLSLAFACAFATFGVDFSGFQGAPSQDTFNCLAENGKEFLIVQIWEGGYGINSDFVGNWQKAKAAGIQYVDGYAFVCNNCDNNDPENVCSSIRQTLPDGFDGMIWLDIEDCDDCWVGSYDDRMGFVQSVASACQNAGLHLGVYSGMGSWGQVFGSSDYDAGSLKQYPLWYAHYDGSSSEDDWDSVRFGGWDSPSMKQYQGTTDFCGTSVDLDAY